MPGLRHTVPAGHLLFDHHAHDLPSSRAGTGSLKVTAVRDRIEDFVTWANREAARHGLAGEVIPADPHGNIGLSRFRRSLAWHIARRPNGLVALAQLRADVPALVRAVYQLTLETQQLRDMRTTTGGSVVPLTGRMPARPRD
jgi:hypothetical protein